MKDFLLIPLHDQEKNIRTLKGALISMFLFPLVTIAVIYSAIFDKK